MKLSDERVRVRCGASGQEITQLRPIHLTKRDETTSDSANPVGAGKPGAPLTGASNLERRVSSITRTSEARAQKKCEAPISYQVWGGHRANKAPAKRVLEIDEREWDVG